MHKIKRNIKSYWILFAVFFLINIFFIWIISNVVDIEEKLKMEQSLFTDKAKVLLFQGGQDSNKDDLLSFFKDKDVVIEGIIMKNNDENNTDVKGLYYNYEIHKSYPLSEGRMFTVDEIQNKKKVALVGYSLKDKIENNIIKINNEDYEVVGIVGDINNTQLKDSIYINFNSQQFNLDTQAITLDINGEETANVALEISKKLNEEKNINTIISDSVKKVGPLRQAIGENQLHLVMGLLAAISLVSTVINLTLYKIDKEKYIFGIKGLLGRTKMSMSISFWIEYEFTIMLSSINAYVFSAIFNNGILSIKILGILMLINIIVSTIAIVLPMINLNRLNINSIIKENI